MNTIGDMISQGRKELKLTQAELALKVYVSPQAVSKWELGKAEPDLKTIVMLSEILHIPYENFLKAIPTSLDNKTCDVCQSSYLQQELKQVKNMSVCKNCQKVLKEEALIFDRHKKNVSTYPLKRIYFQGFIFFVLSQLFLQIVYFIPTEIDVGITYLEYTATYAWVIGTLTAHFTLMRFPSSYYKSINRMKRFVYAMYHIMSGFLWIITLLFWLFSTLLYVMLLLIFVFISPIYYFFSLIHIKKELFDEF